MCNVDLEKHLDRIGIAYETSAFTDGIRPESEEDIKKFEANYASIPAEYRWLLLDLKSGKVRGYNNDYADLEEIAENFSELVLDLVEQVESFSWYNIFYREYVLNVASTIWLRYGMY